MGIAGHRDTFFRPLRNTQQDDIITLTALRGEYRYRVVSINVVSPDNVAVLSSDGSEQESPENAEKKNNSCGVRLHPEARRFQGETCEE